VKVFYNLCDFSHEKKTTKDAETDWTFRAMVSSHLVQDRWPQVFTGFHQSIRISGMAHPLSHPHFFPNPFQFILHANNHLPFLMFC
jgi:hypothetical protein